MAAEAADNSPAGWYVEYFGGLRCAGVVGGRRVPARWLLPVAIDSQ
jgi:hypothetical protein